MATGDAASMAPEKTRDRQQPAALGHASTRRDFLTQALGAAAVAGGLKCTATAAAGSPFRGVILITIDTLRADHLPFYGYPRQTTPFLSSLAANSVVFENAWASSSHTNPSHLSLFSGLHLPQHKLFTNIQEGIAPGIPVLAEVFRDQGYRTAAFCSVSWLKILSQGFSQFSCYEQTPEEKDEGGSHYFPAAQTISKAIAWLDTLEGDSPFFLWVHLFDPHEPLMAPAMYLDQMRLGTDAERVLMVDHWIQKQQKRIGVVWDNDLDKCIAEQVAYDAEILYADAEIGRLYRHAEERGLAANTLWTISADHGEGLGSHDFRGHSMNLYEEQLRVPLLLHAPGANWKQGRRIPDLVQHVDLFPTLGELVGLDLPTGAAPRTGISLAGALRGEAVLPPRFAFAHRQHRYPQGHSAGWEKDPVYALRSQRHKYLFHPERGHEFFDLSEDPMEQRNLADQASPERDCMADMARKTFSDLQDSARDVEEPGLTDAYLDHLKSLGYF